jgi:hypothetical protein
VIDVKIFRNSDSCRSIGDWDAPEEKKSPKTSRKVIGSRKSTMDFFNP